MNLGRYGWVFVVGAVFLLGGACASHRQGAASTGLPGPCAIRGRVLLYGGGQYHKNEPLPGMTLTLKGPALSGVRVARSDGTGWYSFPCIPPGEDYAITVRKEGWCTLVWHLSLQAGQTLDLPLRVQGLCEGDRVDWRPSSMLDYTQAN